MLGFRALPMAPKQVLPPHLAGVGQAERQQRPGPGWVGHFTGQQHLRPWSWVHGPRCPWLWENREQHAGLPACTWALPAGCGAPTSVPRPRAEAHLGLCGHLTGQCWISRLDSNTVW